MGETEIEVARVDDYFTHIGVVALTITAEGIEIGDVLRFKGHTTDAITEVGSMQIEGKQVRGAGVGDSVGIKVPERIRTHDKVYKVLSTE